MEVWEWAERVRVRAAAAKSFVGAMRDRPSVIRIWGADDRRYSIVRSCRAKGMREEVLP
jgi:hypothetical protein